MVAFLTHPWISPRFFSVQPNDPTRSSSNIHGSELLGSTALPWVAGIHRPCAGLGRWFLLVKWEASFCCMNSIQPNQTLLHPIFEPLSQSPPATNNQQIVSCFSLSIPWNVHPSHPGNDSYSQPGQFQNGVPTFLNKPKLGQGWVFPSDLI